MLLRRMPTANRQASQRAHVELVNDIHNELLNEATLINERERKAAALQMLTKSALAQGKGGVELGTGSLGRKHSEPPNLAPLSSGQHRRGHLGLADVQRQWTRERRNRIKQQTPESAGHWGTVPNRSGKRASLDKPVQT